MRTLKTLALVLSTWGLGASNEAGAPSVVEITSEMTFMPREMTAVVGEVVVWKNVSSAIHSVNTVRENCGTEEGKNWVKVPPGALPIFSGEIPPRGEWRIRFEMPGLYQYLCTFHEGHVMRGTIVVQGAGGRKREHPPEQ